MVEHMHLLSLVSQCALLSLHRSGLYYQPVAVGRENFALMSLLDKQNLKTPFYGYHKMMKFLQRLSGEPQKGKALDAVDGYRSYLSSA